ncbi:putative receptor-like protein kinase At3g47110 [Camellia sinensis]|uniref:putative receptor-like protein kinase At3g47110 n=1 Tax=Camellia sinensis TaxID=4442 RepID=UPI0010368F36|nr:putative receptor-like protein kinase At3g47110 [Camellia sinensis]
MSWLVHNLHIYLILLCCLSILNSGFTATMSSSRLMGNDTDRVSLLAIKAKIVEDPLHVLSSWNDSIHFCQWQGVTCSHRHQRVAALVLQSRELVGSISPHIGNLSFLRELRLQNNSFGNEIPSEIGRLPRLQILLLSNNLIGGRIPVNISRCANLVYINFSYNRLAGEVPMELGSLSKLAIVIISVNNLTGSISPFTNLSSLRELFLDTNYFDGSIPDGFDRLKNLQKFALGTNWLSGVIPASLFNHSSLTTFDVTINQIWGSLPWDLGITLPNLEFFSISANQFTGSIPVSISNASKLHQLQLGPNKLTGKVPNLARLQNLKWLSIGDNQLGSREADDLNFIHSLINATNLQHLDVGLNNFGCKFPESIGNLSSNLQVLYLDNNQIFGSIPPGIVNLVGLQSLNMQLNQFTGTIPSGIGKLQNLHQLNLFNNSLSGNIPSSLGNLSLLSKLVLGLNNFQGNIPLSLGNCSNLQKLSLSQNNLNGTIPKQVVSISSLSVYLDLSQNQLSGSLPMEVAKLTNLGYLDVSKNLLWGEIPSTLGSCTSLETLRLGNNFFNGTIPSSLSFLRGLSELDLTNNSLSGVVPTQGVFSNASIISVMGNSKLCGGVAELKLPICNFKVDENRISNNALTLALSIPFGLVGLALVGCVFYLCRFRNRRKDTPSDSSKNSLLRVSYQTLVKATDGFSSFNLIGVGGFGSVYKGVIDGRIVAVKVLNLLRHGASKSFVSECEALRNIRHRNLVKVLTTCSTVDYQGHDFKALIYEFMVNGSLDEWLHPNPNEDLSNEEFKKLNLLQRLNIIIDVACALNYLHNQGQTPIVHCDLKPSNILLNKDMTGHVGDFGLAKFLADHATHDLSTNETSSVGIRGTIGYTAPEYGMGSEVSAYGDIYSFGILMLEMFTGKRPTDEMFKDGLSLHSFVKGALPGSVSEILDPILFQIEGEEEQSFIRSEKFVECLSLILEIGVDCSSELSRERTNINDVVAKLHFIKDTLLGFEIH